MKTITRTVKAQSGAKKTYTVTVTRAKSTSTALKYIKTNSSRYRLTPAFSANVSDYAVTLPAKQSRVTISAKAANSLTKVTVDGKKNSKSFKLSKGQSITVNVVVTAQSGAQKVYTITITRPDAQKPASHCRISDIEQKTAFSTGEAVFFCPHELLAHGVKRYMIVRGC